MGIMSELRMQYKVCAVTRGGWGYICAQRFFRDREKAREFYTDCLVKYLDCEVTIEAYYDN